MARVATNDPLEKFRFRVFWSGTSGTAEDTFVKAADCVAGFHDFAMPKRTTNKITYREGHQPDVMSVSAGLSSMEDITLGRGLLAKTGSEFYAWAELIHHADSTDASLASTGAPAAQAQDGKLNYRKDVTVVMYDRAGVKARAWKLFNAFPVGFVPGSDLNAKEDGEKSMEQLTLAYEDFAEVPVSSIT